MLAFYVSAKSEDDNCLEFGALAPTSFDAADYAAELMGDKPFKVNVIPLGDLR